MEGQMELDTSTLENGITKVSLSGRLDVDGALEIDNEFNQIAEANKNLLIDLSDVSFIASLGIRTLITAAKQTSNNGGKLVILSPQPNVEKVLRESRVDTVMPIIDDMAAVDTVFVS
jgi:anti-anti-sigma factor